MKQLIFILLLISFNAYSQENFSTYRNEYTKATYNIQIAKNKDNTFRLYIDSWSVDKSSTKGGIIIDEKDYNNFVNYLIKSKDKYKEWTETAKSNNVKELDKIMNYKCHANSYFMYGKEWQFAFDIQLKSHFMVLEVVDVKYLLLIKTGQLVSSSNQFMKVSDFMIVFENTDEIDKFLNAIQLSKIKEFMLQPDKKDLFKD
jgi:hypothetical protein